MLTGHPSESDKIVAIIQARMSAFRLPGKVLLDLAEKPMLARIVERTRRSRWIDQVVVATSSDKTDDPIESFCSERDYPYFRGNLHDVLDRYYQAAVHFSADVVVRITADCPIIDPVVIDQTILAFYGQGPSLINRNQDIPEKNRLPSANHSSAWDFAANRLPPPWKRTFPIGLDTEVCTISALEAAWRNANRAHQREHVMPYLYEEDQDFKVLIVNHEPDYGEFRLTVDTPPDLELLNLIYEQFDGEDSFSWYEVLDFLKKNPALMNINAEIEHKDYSDFEITS
jgi:spore coat polysaccharide biosynthesis protein SpsF